MIITRDWIRDDIVIHCDTNQEKVLVNTYTKQDLCEFINYWKLKLLSLGAKRGDRIGTCIKPSDIHTTAINFAAFELGMSLVVLHRPNNEKECLAPKSNCHLPLDFLIFFSLYLTNPSISMAMQHYRKNSKVVLSYGTLEWETQSKKFRSTEETPILAQPDDVALLCNSSGTTGTPKLIAHTHKFLHELCSNNWKDLGYVEDDHYLHISSLNHGATLALVLPSYRICKHHYFYNNLSGKGKASGDSQYKEYARFVKDCIKHNITKIFCTHGGVLDELIKHLESHNIKLPNMDIIILSFISPEWCSIVKQGGLRSISSPFGCSEVCGPVFMMWLTADNADNFNPRYLGRPTDSFYKTKVIDGRIHTSASYIDEIVFDDIVEEKSDGYYFVGKNRLQKINDIDINPLDIMEILEKYTTRYQFEIYIDEVYNQLYVLTTDSKAYDQRESIKKEIDAFYHGNVTVTDIIYEPMLYDATISNKADKDKLAGIVERYRLTFHKNSL
jgi:acyl-CoA synthetase (AMP-forming)/AMP-acid ligase II